LRGPLAINLPRDSMHSLANLTEEDLRLANGLRCAETHGPAQARWSFVQAHCRAGRGDASQLKACVGSAIMCPFKTGAVYDAVPVDRSPHV